MVKSSAQSGRLKTLIHPGPVAGVHVTTARRMGISRDSARGLERRATASIRQLSAGFADYLQA